MSRIGTILAGFGLVVVLVLSACAAPADEVPAAEPEPAPGDGAAAAEPEVAAEPAEPVEEVTEEAATEVASAEPTPAPPTETLAPAPATFVIVADESEARFAIDEVLAGNDKRVVGRTNAVEGQLSVDFANPQQSSVGLIRVDLSTLATDNNFRNRALREAILETINPEFQFAEFAPTAINGLPESVSMGEPFDFQIAGDLTIHGTTRPVTFDATAIPVSEERIEGSAAMTIPYREFVVIPRLPEQVASVSDDVTLEFDFVAVPAE